MARFMDKVRTLRLDDHRYYHQSRINQTLHLVSAVSFLYAYALLFTDPATAGLVGWLVGMVTRQSGHIFWEPRGHDAIHDVSYAYKESIKAGYNMHRKSVLIGVWLSIPVVLQLRPDLFGMIEPARDFAGFAHDTGIAWLCLGVAGLALRTVHLSLLRGPSWGFAWACKILTDPFHNVDLYWKSPIALLHGELLDPMDDCMPDAGH
ncbi:hypothetical protein NMQ14_11580 [Methyloversatilis sp. XJ19-13]|uniref:hypothetical protein n=1 Tax=Methyloversatilis sp. XJ19-13 TaxID=2963430 RepID=UPI00211CB5FD|nr:hypothetical protein [Methyloversatilis sp. XJ19-13]MCQ9374887.1 hypothetical protein [Methyloversatilis sp. XJ19-13]